MAALWTISWLITLRTWFTLSTLHRLQQLVH